MSQRVQLEIVISYDDDDPAPPSRTETGLIAAVIHNRHAHLCLEREKNVVVNGTLAIASLAGVESADLSAQVEIVTDEVIMNDLHTFVTECFPHLKIKINIIS